MKLLHVCLSENLAEDIVLNNIPQAMPMDKGPIASLPLLNLKGLHQGLQLHRFSTFSSSNTNKFNKILLVCVCLPYVLISGSSSGLSFRSENTGKFLLRNLVALGNSIYYNSQCGALMNRFPVMMTPAGWREFPTIF